MTFYSGMTRPYTPLAAHLGPSNGPPPSATTLARPPRGPAVLLLLCCYPCVPAAFTTPLYARPPLCLCVPMCLVCVRKAYICNHSTHVCM